MRRRTKNEIKEREISMKDSKRKNESEAKKERRRKIKRKER